MLLSPHPFRAEGKPLSYSPCSSEPAFPAGETFVAQRRTNTATPLPCRNILFRQSRIFEPKGDRACSRSSVRPYSFVEKVCQKSWIERQRCNATLSSGPAF